MLASSALAQSYNPEFGDANVLNVPQTESTGNESYARTFGFAPSEEHWDRARDWSGENARASMDRTRGKDRNK